MSVVDFPWLRPEFSPTAVVLALGLLAYLVIFEPLLGLRSFAHLRRHRGDDPRALTRVYLRTLGTESGWLVVVALIFVVSPDLDPGALGLRHPSGRLLAAALGFTAFAMLAQIGVALAFRRGGTTVAATGDYAYLIPVSPAERRLAGLVATGAGVSEEVVVRGLVIRSALAPGNCRHWLRPPRRPHCSGSCTCTKGGPGCYTRRCSAPSSPLSTWRPAASCCRSCSTPPSTCAPC